MTTFDEFYASLDPDIGIRGKQFEKFVRWFLKTDPTWGSQIKKVWLWKDYPRRWREQECGIDLVYEDNYGRDWAVQSKCISPKNDITKSEIDSFLSESNDSRFEGRLLIASTDGIGLNAQQVIYRQEKKVVCFLLEQFRQSEIEFPSSMESLDQGRRKEKKKPRPHQIEAIEKVNEGLKTADRGQVLMACGTGKTLTSLWIKEKIYAKQVLILVPSLSLLSQTLREWNAEANESFKWICVCSDKSVAKDKSEDQWIANTSEIGVPVTSETLEIKNFLDESGSKVVFATYQSSQLIVEAQEHHDTSDFDLVIADESHRCAGKVSNAFGSVLEEDKIKASKRLFFTATPRILTQNIKSNALDRNIDVASMDDNAIFGEVIYQIKFSDAIKQNLLSDYQVIVIGVDDPMINKQIIRRELLTTDKGKSLDAESLANNFAIYKSIKDYNLKKIITFHSRIKNASEFAENFENIINLLPESERNIKELTCQNISGLMKTSDRNRIISSFKKNDNYCKILTNAKCLSEGVDIPELDGIAFIDPKKSQIDIIQAVGRAIRKSSEKKIGTIIIPVYLGETENIEEELFNSRFNDIWKIILALKSQDDYLTEVIDKMRVDLGSNRFNQNDLKKIIFDMPQKLNPRFSKALKPLLVKNTSESWIENYGRLKEFFQNNGHSVIPQKEFLGKWISTQRQEFKKNKISKYRIEKLNKLNFIWDQKENDWFVNYETIKGFIKEGIDLSKLDKKSSISYWIGSQRFRYRKQKIEKYRLELLNKINFPFNPINENWDEKFEKYKQLSKKYQDMSNHPKIRQSTLGVWISTQRESFKKGTLSKERLEKLNSVDFIFDVSLNHWTAQFKKLKDFLKDNDWEDLDPKLQSWCNLLRVKKRKGKLKANQKILLESLGIQWDPVNNSWGEYYEKLKIFKEEEGHLDIPSKHAIGIWVVNQRRLFKENKISDVRVKLLDDIGFIWDTQKYRWQQNFQKLRAKGLNSKVDNQDPILRNWKAKQRLMFKRGELGRNKIELLESIGFNWNPEEDDWYSKFEELISFKKINGHLNVPQRGTPLGTWVSSQRKSKSSGKINNKKVELLESIGFMWNVNDAQWKDTFLELKKYLDKNENSYPPTNSPLGIKISSLRKSYNLGRLSNEKIQLLNSINFIWNQKDYEWNKKVNELRTLIEKNNYDSINFNEYPTLKIWVENLRSRFKAGLLSEKQIDDLNSFNFIWDHLDYIWQKNFNKLKSFIDKNGHAKPSELDDRKLNTWVSTQRADFKKNTISQKRVNDLNSLNGWLWDAKD